MGRVGFVPPSFLLHYVAFVLCWLMLLAYVCMFFFCVFFGFGGVGVAVLSKNTHSPGMKTW